MRLQRPMALLFLVCILIHHDGRTQTLETPAWTDAQPQPVPDATAVGATPISPTNTFRSDGADWQDIDPYAAAISAGSDEAMENDQELIADGRVGIDQHARRLRVTSSMSENVPSIRIDEIGMGRAGRR